MGVLLLVQLLADCERTVALACAPFPAAQALRFGVGRAERDAGSQPIAPARVARRQADSIHV